MQSRQSSVERIFRIRYVDSETKKRKDEHTVERISSHSDDAKNEVKIKNRNIWSYDAVHTDQYLLEDSVVQIAGERKKKEFCRSIGGSANDTITTTDPEYCSSLCPRRLVSTICETWRANNKKRNMKQMKKTNEKKANCNFVVSNWMKERSAAKQERMRD